MKKKQILIDNSIITYCQSEKFNPDNCILFLHGWGMNYNSFSKIYEELDKTRKISYIGIDFPGFGGSGLKRKNFTIFDYADFSIKFIKKLKLKKPSLVGHSFGGRISIILGAKYDNLNKIILIGSAGIKPDINYIRQGIVKIGKVLFSIPGLRLMGNIIKNNVCSSDYISSGKLKQIFLNVINEDLTNLLDKISYKTLLIWGEKDTETPLNDGQLMNKLIKKSKLKTFEKGTHFVFQEYSKEISKMILDFQNK